MSLVKRLTDAWKVLTAPKAMTSDVLIIMEEETPQTQNVFPSSIDKTWLNDEQLRALAQDSKEKTTHWVIAGDFEELFSWLDNFNDNKPDELQMKMEVSGQFHEDLKMMRDGRLYGGAVSCLGAKKETIVIAGSNIQRTFGPMFISDKDIRLSIGDVKIPTYYRGSMMDNTSINFHVDGQWTEIEFGMGHVPEFFGGKKPEKITQATMQPALGS